jgi:diguanylate cyclase (GGDEF)-like protein/PAS domain S-box-containing protein
MPGIARSVMAALAARGERFFVPAAVRPDGQIDERATRQRYMRIVCVIAAASVIVFAPSLSVAGVPVDRWPAYLLAVVAAAVVISASLLASGRRGRWGLVAAAANAGVIAGLAAVIGEHYHQLALLFALVVVGHASIHGVRAALVMVACGTLLVPFVIMGGHPANLTDPVYALIYLLGMAAVIWTRDRLTARASDAIQASEAKYRALVEWVPAVVYTADFGMEGAWRYVSPRVEQLLGFPASEWTGDPGFWWSRVHPEDQERVLADDTEAASGPPGQRSAIEYRMVDAEGRTRWVRDEAVVIAPDAGSPSYWSGFLVDITDRMMLEAQLQHQAFHDPLTGLANRALFADRVEHAVARSRRHRESVAVLFLDLDDFKMVNDGLGHDAGDELLVAVSEVLQEALRSTDTAARLGGDEFAILLEDLPSDDAATEVADRVLEALARPFQVHGREVVIGASIGIAVSARRTADAREILRNADSAMYAAKRRGKGCHQTYLPEMHAAAARRLEVIAEIRQALEREELRVHYQPTVRLHDGSIAGFEALVRWHHPRHGLVLPGEFIPAAEETGQIVAIGRFVLDEACRQARAWADQCPRGQAPPISVNVSARQFRDPSLGPTVAAALSDAGLSPSSLILEITESVVMEDSEASLRRLQELKALGVRLAIDDFGTGYSSLSYLRRFPVDTIKIDKSFIDGVAAGGDALALAHVIVRMGQTLNLETVAEGVELPSQAAALRRMGCRQAQGFYFARPMVADDATDLLTRGGQLLPLVG